MVWQELQRREVTRLAVIYVVSSWVLVQVADLLLEAWGYPEESVQFVVKAAVFGFPLALIFGWFFDFRNGRLFRTGSLLDGDAEVVRLGSRDYPLLSVVSLAVVALIAWAAVGIGPPPGADADAAFETIVVLPFEGENRSEQESRLGTGFAEALRTTLSRQDRFTVIAGRSILELLSKGFSSREIQRELDAAYVVSGTIDASEDKIGVSAHLIDGSHRRVLEEYYSRGVTDILWLQRAVAEAFATEIAITLPEAQQAEAAGAVDPVAFQFSQLGRRYFHSREQGWQQSAREAFEKAIEADPDYAAPYAGLALIDSVNRIGNLPDEEVAEIKKLIDKSLTLDPNLGMGHAAFGFWAWSRDGALAAIPHFRKAIELDPMLMNAYPWLAITLAEVGEFEASYAVRKQAIEKDPLNPISANAYAQHHASAGNFEEAERALLRIAALPEPWPAVMPTLQVLYREYGKRDKAVEYAKKHIRQTQDLSEGSFSGHLCMEYARAGLFDDADYWYERQFPDGPATLNGFANRAFIYKAQGNYTAAAATARQFTETASPQELDPEGVGPLLVAYFLALNGELEDAMEYYGPYIPEEGLQANFVGFDPVGAEVLGAAMWVLQQVGRGDEAQYFVDETVRASEYLVEMGQGGNPEFMEKRALLHVLNGELDEALAWMEKAVDGGWRDYYVLRDDPRWQALLELPEAVVLLEKVNADLEEQAARIRETDLVDGFREFAETLRVATP